LESLPFFTKYAISLDIACATIIKYLFSCALMYSNIAEIKMDSRREFLLGIGSALGGLTLPPAAQAWGRRRCSSKVSPPCSCAGQASTYSDIGYTWACPQTLTAVINNIWYYHATLCDGTPKRGSASDDHEHYTLGTDCSTCYEPIGLGYGAGVAACVDDAYGGHLTTSTLAGGLQGHHPRLKEEDDADRRNGTKDHDPPMFVWFYDPDYVDSSGVPVKVHVKLFTLSNLGNGAWVMRVGQECEKPTMHTPTQFWVANRQRRFFTLKSKPGDHPEDHCYHVIAYQNLP
jgi:hypothetical protein